VAIAPGLRLGHVPWLLLPAAAAAAAIAAILAAPRGATGLTGYGQASGIAENDALNWPHCDVLNWPHLSVRS
jgi:hypothetical protein